ncbi:glycoside hydrolase family 31 protein [Acidipropionibacterium virtanenii]|uniref:Alpha-xylosidase n=1 Tax=Acidipropionibacterium virtanenii TaxID=2057246 RepID=A0A344UQZ0_9ACTN|nr:glycoside hydrolase family 31 protein [Acidipropionibacterium virtanenii]AXE37688.1 Alpha-xylosidase [Acidipropionibacterium virtanenii]
MTDDYMLKYVSDVHTGSNELTFDVAALRTTRLPHTPGWLTGESPEDQGIETGMPNLPQDLQLPPVEQIGFKARVRALGPATLRIQLAPADHQMWREPDCWPGIMTASTNGDPTCTVTSTDDVIRVELPEAELRIGTRPLTLSLYREGRLLMRTGQRLRQVAGFPMAPPALSCDESISLNLEMDTTEQIYGFGEQFSPLRKNGQRLVLEVNDALGTGTGRTYKPAPVWHSTNGYSAFINTGANVTADIGHERPSVLGLTLDDSGLDLIMFAAPTPEARLGDYTALTGTAKRPPLWAFGYWMGRCRYHSSTEMLEVGKRMREESIPADVLHLDPDWLIVDRLQTDYIWNEERFGNRKKFIDDLAELGLRLSMWEVPYLDPASPLFEEAESGGHLLRNPDGRLAHIEGTPTPDGRFRALFDLSRPETRAWILDKQRPFFDDGLAVIKTDFGEGCPPGAVSADGTPGNYIHNLYTLKYNGAIYDMIGDLTGRTPFVWARSGWAGSQRYPGQWGGDAESTVVGMQATLRGGLSYASCVPSFWSHDIGGFYGPELTPGLYIRWTQFGAFSPLMRAHGLRPREPWEFGEQALEVCRDWIRLRYSLLPYLWQVGREVETKGLPFIRPLCLEYPDDRVAIDIDDEYLFGHDLLVAPVMDDGTDPVTRSIYLPEGTWYDFFTDERFEGPGFIERKVSIEQLPVLVRDGAVIPRVDVDGSVRSTDDLLDRPWTVHVWDNGETDLSGLEGFDGTPEIAQVIKHG